VDATGDPRAPRRAWRLALALAVAAIATGVLQASQTALSLPLGSAFVPLGFALLAVLASIGDTDPLARPLALVLLTAVASALAMGSLALVVLHVVEPGSLGAPSREVDFDAGGEARLSFMMALLALSIAATALALFRGVREAVRDIIPIDPARFSHALALSASVAVTLVPLLPLFVLGRPPLPLPPGALPAGSPMLIVPSFGERSIELAWFAVASLLVARGVGRRPWPEVRARLGLVAASPWMFAAAAALGAVLAWTVVRTLPLLTRAAAAGSVLPWLPSGTPSAALVGFALLTATGTEITFRGLLQPRLGLVLSSVVLAAPLAWVSPWTGLFLLVGLGLLFGVLRLAGGTASAWVAHVVFLLVTIAIS
jgi:hypothetical protein